MSKEIHIHIHINIPNDVLDSHSLAGGEGQYLSDGEEDYDTYGPFVDKQRPAIGFS
jgi:hypothetical protein